MELKLENRKIIFLRIKLIGNKKNKSGLGTKVTLKYNGKTQFHDHSIYRGYLSTVEDVVHFGLGTNTSIDTVTVEWPDGDLQSFYDVNANQVLQVKHSSSNKGIAQKTIEPSVRKNTYVKEISAALGVKYKHQEWDKIDFYKQRTLPHKFSQAGPGMAVGDVNGDGTGRLYNRGVVALRCNFIYSETRWCFYIIPSYENG